MKFFLSIHRVLGVCIFQCLPILLHAQEDRNFLNTPFSSPNANFPDNPGQNPSYDTTGQTFIIPTEQMPLLPKGEDRKINDILDFWFGPLADPAQFPTDKVSIWFSRSPEVDRQIRESYTKDVLAALNGEYNHWRQTPKGRLALILLLDQFTRHIYRDRAQEFVGDPMARGLVLEGLQQGDDQSLYPIQKAFFYLPLEHAEDLEMQNLSVSLYRKLLRDSPQAIKPKMDAFLQYAILHRRQIASFGRFPHRNANLKRKSTPEEIIFLKQWGDAAKNS